MGWPLRSSSRAFLKEHQRDLQVVKPAPEKTLTNPLEPGGIISMLSFGKTRLSMFRWAEPAFPLPGLAWPAVAAECS